MRRCDWQLSCDTAFEQVLDACAAPRADEAGTWITRDMRDAYIALHRLGFAHSIEVHDGDTLVGGLYGVRLGRVFFGESMFSRRSNASKMAMAGLVWLGSGGSLALIDCQVESDHLASLGARTISRGEFELRLTDAITTDDIELSAVAEPGESLDRRMGRLLPTQVRGLL